MASILIAHGFDVWRPVMADRCDFAVSKGSAKFARIQVKTASYHKGRNSFRSTLHLQHGHVRHQYRPDDFDYFMVCCLSTTPAFYVIPAEAGFQFPPFSGLQQMSLGSIL